MSEKTMEQIRNHPDQISGATAVLVLDNVRRVNDFTLFCRNQIVELSQLFSADLNNFLIDTDGRCYTSATRRVGLMRIVQDALSWVPAEEFFATFDAVNALYRNISIDREFLSVVKGSRSFRTKMEMEKNMSPAFNLAIQMPE